MKAVSADLITAARRGPGTVAWHQLRAHCAESPFFTTLPKFQSRSACMELDARLELHDSVHQVFAETMHKQGIAAPDAGFLFDFVLPLLEELRQVLRATLPHPCLIGLAGGPGVGKTTLSEVLAACLAALDGPQVRCMRVSIDDFYLAPEERARRGFAWRTLPGTHDLDRLQAFLDDFDGCGTPLTLPRYDLGRDRPGPPRNITPRPNVCIFDGAMVGTRLPGYVGLANRLDHLVFLDAPLSLLKDWRFSREARLRAQSGGAAGLPPTRMQAFWDEALAPSVTKYVRPNRIHADLVLTLGAGRALKDVSRRQPPHLATPDVRESRHG